MAHDGVPYHAFPTPPQIARAAPDALHVTKVTFRRVAQLQAIAGLVADGALNLEALRHAPPHHAFAQLVALKGVGPWSAAWTLIRGMGVYSHVGHNDVALRAAVGHLFGDGTRPTADQTAAHFARYGEYAGRAAFVTLMHWATVRDLTNV